MCSFCFDKFKINKDSNSWYSQHSILKLFNVARCKYILDNVYNINDEIICDLGCGGGILTIALAKMGATKIVGVDKNKDALNEAKEIIKLDNLNKVKFINSCIYDFCKKEENFEKFSLVILSEVIEHLDNPVEIINLINNILKPEGKIFISTINKNLISLINIIFLSEYVFKIIPKNTHQYNKFIKPFDLQVMLSNANINLKDISAINFDLINRSFYLGGKLNSNYIMYGTKN